MALPTESVRPLVPLLTLVSPEPEDPELPDVSELPELPVGRGLAGPVVRVLDVGVGGARVVWGTTTSVVAVGVEVGVGVAVGFLPPLVPATGLLPLFVAGGVPVWLPPATGPPWSEVVPPDPTVPPLPP
jgi:hypothetical protein